ncbi:MAG: DUF3821 domain-containing protein [Methanofollis sp.]|uniref:DUF3821 domain-containing protein n=1 Tax=Methanofollis sp. TaxID=2052835 RepID=UPI00261E0E1B|nr:DUF3821 domain-containing protein [Methanofollis sp.]MDD4254102.1 DUF3821 domain-containing protein [Methanofollis sp.]
MARGTTISDIRPGDTVFVYETGLDLTALRNATTDNPVTALQRFNDDDPKKGLINTVPVADDTNFDLIDASVGDDTGLYFAYNSQDGITNRIYIRYPEVSIDAVLAAPNHAERIEGISVPTGTGIAFRVISPDVGTYYAAGETRAAVELVLTTPGGAEMTTFGGRDFSNLPITNSVFYTDDPGRPGPVALENLEEGTYKVQARWTSPQGFADDAEDSNVITFSVGNRVGVNTTPTTAATTAPTTVPTMAVTTETTAPETTATTPFLTTAVTTETTAPETTMTQASGTLIPALGAAALLLFALRRR